MAVSTMARARPPFKWTETLKNFWIDIALFLMFIFDMNTHLTGIPVHEWLGIVFGGALVYHILLHWQWISNGTRKLFAKLPTIQRIRYGVDLLLFVVMVIVVASGIWISRAALPAVGLALAPNRFWSGLHHVTSELVIFLVGLHIALSWSWLTNAWQRFVWHPLIGKQRSVKEEEAQVEELNELEEGIA
ncbi:MAG: cytochrome b/b6 domain-containing protein [Caldilineaceae bacterium]|nr:cytochrome b/b6 domain-containing protein [Caldilineaceae bacterium]